jgi:hypothetical protein
MLINTIIIISAIIIGIYLLRKGVNTGYIMLGASIVVVISAGIKPMNGLIYAFHGVVSDKTLKLILLLFLIMMIENIMRTSGMIKTMVENLKMLVGSKKIAAALMPAVMGILPSPGGARFSCPMVQDVLGDSVNSLDKAFINYWFRHIWLEGFILYPGVIVAAGLLNISVIIFFLHLLPFIFFTAIIGWVFGFVSLRKSKDKKDTERKISFNSSDSHSDVDKSILITEVDSKTAKKGYAIKFFSSVFPILSLIVIFIVLSPFSQWSLEISSISVIIGLTIYNKYGLKKILFAAKEAFPIRLVILIIGVMLFKQVLSESCLIDKLPTYLDKYGIPDKALFLILPFLGAISSGLTISYVSITFPILIHLGMSDNLWLAALAFTAGNIGCNVTPLHLCAVMTADYFKVPLGKLLVRIIRAELIIAIFICILIVFI